MTRVALYAAAPEERDDWIPAIAAAAREAQLDLELIDDPAAIEPQRVDYLILGDVCGVGDLRSFVNLRAMLSLWAGVDALVKRPDLPRDVPLARMVEPGMTLGMTNYVVAHAMRAHMDLDRMLAASAAGRWDKFTPPLTSDRAVGVLGLGALGQHAAQALAALGFRVSGWSRSPKTIVGVDCHHGLDGLARFLADCEILALLAPLTEDTRGLLNAERLAQLPEGAHIINAARGPLLVEADLLAAIFSGHIGGATLDVFDVEPLPEDHPYWREPRITVTPHLASATRFDTASKQIVNQIQRDIEGAPLQFVVDQQRGY